MSSRMRSSYLKPPLPKSPIRLRSSSRQVLPLPISSSSTLQTPPGKTNQRRRLSHGDVESKLPIEYSSSISKDVKTRAEASNLENLAADSAPVFERGRFYDEYSARRNERLKRKNGGEESVIKGTPYNLGVEPTTTKRRGTVKKKATTTVETTATKQPRYSLRSMTMTKENKKPSPPLPINVAVTCANRKTVTTTTMRGRRI